MTQPTDQATICSYYVKSLRTGEYSARMLLEPHVAEDAISRFGEETFEGRTAVLTRATGLRPMTAFIRRGGFSPATEEDGRWVVRAEYPPTVDQRRVSKITFSFNAKNEISEIDHELTPAASGRRLSEVPLAVRAYINDALANDTPMTIAHVNDEGKPVVSIRGGLQFFGDRQLSGWLRNAHGGLASAVAERPDIFVFYRDQIRKVTFFIEGKGHVVDDPAIRDTVYDMLPEAEQAHDAERAGACLLIDIEKLYGAYGGQPVMIQPQ